MACRLSEDQISALFGAVHGEVIASKNRDDKFNALQAIRDLYKKLVDAGAEPVNALDYIQHMPSMMLLSYAMFEDAKGHMRKSQVNLSELDQLDADFNADIANVAKFILPAQAGAEAAKEIIEESNPSTGVLPTEAYGEVEGKDLEKKKTFYQSETSFVAAPETALAVFNQEAKAYDGVEADQNIVDADPVKRAYYSVVRKLNTLMSKYNRPTADKLSLGNVTGIYLRLVPASKIAFEDLQQSDKDYYSKDDAAGTPFAKTAQQKMEQREKGDETYLVFTDSKGNILYFNEEGTPVDKANGGMVAYGKMRRPYTPGRTNEAKGQVAGQRMVGRVQTVADLVRKGLGTEEELSKERDQEMDILQKSREYVVSNPEQVLLFSVTPGKNGYIKEDFSKSNLINSIELPEGFKPWVANQETGTLVKGGVYFNVPGYEFPLLVRRPKFANVPNLVQNLADMVFDGSVSNADKIKTLKQFTFSNDTNIYEDADGKLFIKQNGKEMTATAENKAEFINTLNGQTVNINKDLINTTFSMPVNMDGTVSMQPERYNNFLSDNFFTYLATNDQGKIVSLNAYNVIYPTTETQTKIFGEVKVEAKEKTSELEQSTPTDNTVDEFRSMLDNANFTLRKSLLQDSTATKEQIDAAEKWYNNSPLSKIVPFQTMFNVVNSNALAEFTVSGITLWSGSNFTDLYHEAWHAFSQMFLTKEQKRALYSEARKLTGSFKTANGRTVKFKAATDMQLEEFMAEDFRKYVLSDRKNVIDGRPTRNTVFRKIFNFLKQIFSGYSLKDIAADQTAVKGIQELYDKLYVGDINDYTPSVRNVQFGVLNKGVEAINAEQDGSLNYQDSMTLVESIDSLIASTLAGYNVSVASIFTRPELLAGVYSKVKKDLEQLRAGIKEENSASKILDFALANWGNYSNVAKGEEATGVLAFHKKRSTYFTFEDKLSETDGYDQRINEDAADAKDGDNLLAKTEQELREDYGNNVFERKGNEQSVRELASNEVVYLIKSLPQVDRKGNVVTNALGVPKLVDFNKTWGTVINTVAGSNTTSQMYGKLLDAATRFPELNALVKRLGNPMDYTQTKDWPYMKMWISFFRDFSVYRVPIKEGRLVQSEDSFRFEFSEVDPQFRQVEKTFQAQFQAQPAGPYINKTGTGSELNTAQIMKDFPYRDIFGKDYAIINEDKALQFLRAAGFYLSDNNAIREKINENFKSVGFIYNAIKGFAEKKTSVSNPVAVLRKSEATSVKKILNIEAQDSGNYTNNAVMNVNGDMVFDLSLNNSITKLLNDLNDLTKDYTMVQQAHLQHLDYKRNPFAKYSMWLNSMFSIPSGKLVDMKNINQRKASTANYAGGVVTLDIVNLDGIKNVVEKLAGGQSVEQGLKTTNLDPVSKFILDLHTMLGQGVMELPRHASKSTAYGVSVSKIDSPFNTDKTRHLYISPGYFADANRSLAYTVDLFLPKIAAEMERMAMVKQGIAPNIPGFNERGTEFTMFDDILTDATKTQLKELANAEDSLSPLSDPAIKQSITNDVRNYLDGLYKENMELFQEMPFISEDLLHKSRDQRSDIAAYIRKDLGKSVGEDQTALLKEVAVKAFTVNALFHNMEAMSVLYGDLAMYNNNKEEYHKRNAAIGSTGRIFASDEATNQFINNLGRAYARKMGFAEKGFDGTLKTAVFKDNKVSSLYYDEYLEALTGKYGAEKAAKILAPYKEMNEGDAQGWITFDTYRILSILEGAWSDKQNELYNKVIDGEEISSDDLAEFFPTKKFQYAGPLKTNKLHVQGFHKFSLVPMVPSLIKGTNMETLHDNMVKQGVDYGLFESGSKLATITSNGKPDSLYENDDASARTIKPWNEGDATYTPNEIFIQYLKDQVDIQSTWKNKTVFSTQLRKLIINDTFKQGLALTGDFEKLVTDFEGLLDELQEYKKNELLKEAGWAQDASGKVSGSVKSLMEFVVREMERLELPEHDLDFVRDGLKSGTFTDLSFSLNAEKIEKMLNNIVVKRLVKQKMNGEQLVQVSGAGFESQNRYTNPSEEEIKKYRGTNDLPTYRPGKGKNGKTTAMKVKIALKGDYYKLLNLKHSDGNAIGTRERLNDMLKDDTWLDSGDNRKMITMVGVRIPVQGLNSMEFMEVYEFLPEEAGSIIVPPAEIVAKSGSDFDIDKLTIFQPNIGEKKGQPVYKQDKGVKATENKIVEKIREILEHPDNFDALIRPNDTDLVKGVANELAKENIQGYNPLANKTKAAGSKISPTRTLEPRYNLYKHESNNVGKKTLGIGAVDNAYSSIFKRVGARLEKSYTHYKREDGQIVWDKEPQVRPINIRMDHNVVTENGKEYISLSDIDTVTKDKISDLIGQLMNGWVDIEKDAWIFNINGNNIAGPVLLFLLESGVDFKTAAYFVSQPLVVDYIKELYKVESPFYNAANPSKQADPSKGLRKYNVKKDFYVKYRMGGLSKFGNLNNDLLYAAIAKYNKDRTYDVASLQKVITNKDKNSPEAIAGLLHFIELEELTKQLTNVKLTVNVDTAPSKSLYSATERLDKIEDLQYVDAVPSKMIDKILTESPISSFLVQDFQLGILRPLMELRGDAQINNFLLTKIQARNYTTAFATPEKFVAAFHNDLPLYMLQNYIKGIDLANMKEYKGLAIEQAVPVKSVVLKQGAFVKDGVMYTDMQQIEDDFNNKAYASDEYTKQGLAKVDPGTFDMGTKYQNLQEYTHFVLEREYLRSVTPVGTSSKENYEQKIATRALERTFNFYHMLKAPTVSVADQFLNIKAKYPNLAKDYMIMDQLGYVNESAKVDQDGNVMQANNKKMRTLKLISDRLDTDMINVLHENLVRLSDPMTVKVDNPVQNAEISKFFNRLIVAEYIRAGITKGGGNLAKILPSSTLMKLMAEPLSELSNNKNRSALLERYHAQFMSLWSGANSSTRLKYRNYLSREDVQSTTATDMMRTPDQVIDGKSLNENKQGLLVYPTIPGAASARKLLDNHNNVMFVYANAKDSANITGQMDKADNTISFPLTLDGKAPLTDDTFEENAKKINDAITAIETQYENGNEVAFPEQGITMQNGKDLLAKAPRTKSYMATELYKRLNYLTPGMQYDAGVRAEMQANQDITDEMVEEFMKKCFGE